MCVIDPNAIKRLLTNRKCPLSCTQSNIDIFFLQISSTTICLLTHLELESETRISRMGKVKSIVTYNHNGTNYQKHLMLTGNGACPMLNMKSSK